MKFANIILAAGLDAHEYPNLSKMSVTVYDRKRRKITAENLHFVNPLFVRRPDSLQKFMEFLTKYEAFGLTFIEVKIDEGILSVYPGSSIPLLFMRI